MATDPFLNQLHREDCIAGMAKLPAGSVDLAFADPPFNIGYEYDVYDDARDRQHYLSWSRDWITAVYRVLKPAGAFWLAIGDEYAAELKLLSQDIGFHCRSWVVWYYTFGVNCTRKFSRSHAHLFHFVKDPTQFTFNSDALENRIPSARQLVYADSRANPFGRLPDDTWVLRPQDLADCFTPSEDTWYFPRVAGTFKERAGFHGCQMPEQLLGRIIRLCSHANEVVFDPFTGSATTLVAAKKLGRVFVGFEISLDYAEQGTQRLEQVRRGDPLDGAPEPLVSAPATPSGHVGQRANSHSKKDGKSKHVSTPEGSAFRTPSQSIRENVLFEKGLIEAFRNTNDGYSLDRVIADPELNQRLVEECRSLGLPGDARTWNWRLFNYRKAGKLVGIPTERRTAISWEDCDQFLFASEIALAQMLEDDCSSLDEILCDPELAARFDKIAQTYAPNIQVFKYRWAALKLWKEAKLASVRAKVLAPARLSKPVPLSDVNWQKLTQRAGLYLVTGDPVKEKLYVGETLHLQNRLQNQFRSDLLTVWLSYTRSQSLYIRLFEADPKPPELLAYQCRLVDTHKPKLNFTLKPRSKAKEWAA